MWMVHVYSSVLSSLIHIRDEFLMLIYKLVLGQVFYTTEAFNSLICDAGHSRQFIYIVLLYVGLSNQLQKC